MVCSLMMWNLHDIVYMVHYLPKLIFRFPSSFFGLTSSISLTIQFLPSPSAACPFLLFVLVVLLFACILRVKFNKDMF
ncbi:hypothetical protein MtrunA17_Chr1g0178571 [Medicago truncatula]|uniref:Transmembrane protein n=1 Tax=Medicago truncatula TaxID=3880 RepID=A0A396JMP6_MEDTR|nr:hypothetical protein MtrunA17_Chr1g0178571 [Medicago truncatula]